MRFDHEPVTPEQEMALFGDLLFIYLSVGSALGDCDLYRRMGRALASNNVQAIQDMMDEYNELSRNMRDRILAGDTSFSLEDFEEAGLEDSKEEAPEAKGIHSKSA